MMTNLFAKYRRWTMVGIWLLLLNLLPSKPIYAQCDFINDITGITQSVPPAGDAANPLLYTQTYVLVDHLGVIYATNATPDFLGVPAGLYFLYAVNYANTEAGAVLPLLAVGQDWSNVVAYGDNVAFCLNYTPAYTGCAISVCDEMDVCDETVMSLTASGFNASGYTQTYCLVCAGVVQAISAAGSFDLAAIAAATPGANCQVMAVNFETATGNPVAVGANWSAVETAQCSGTPCFAFMGMDLNITASSVALTSVTNVSCNGGNNGAVNITPSGAPTPYTFSWSNGATTEDITGLTAGTYTVTVSNANGCTSTVSATVTQPSALTVPAPVVTNVSCNGGNNGAVNISPAGGTSPYTFSWSNGANTEDITGLVAGNYTVTVQDANLCTATAAATVTQPSAITVTVDAVVNTTCGSNNGSISITPSGGTGGYTYQWSGGQTAQDITGLATGSYTVTVLDANLCQGTATANVGNTAGLSATTTVTDVSCNGGNNGAINLTPSGGTGPYTFIWSTTATTEDVSGLTAGTYSVTITDATLCAFPITGIAVGEPSAINVATTAVTNVSCNGGNNGAINITPSGGTGAYTFSWSNGPTSEDITGLTAGTYSVTVSDANLCVGTASITITEPTALTVPVPVVTNVSCNGGNNGAVNISPSGGTGAYTFSWSNGANTEDITGLTAGTYVVTVSDANLCSVTVSATVTQPSAITVPVPVVTNVSCNGGNNGAVNISPTGGTGAYTFSWSNSATSEDITGLVAGTYNVTVSDANLCTVTASATVTEPTALTVPAPVVTNVTCNGGNNGAVNISPTGGTGAYTFSWSNGPTTEDITGLAAGTYSVTVRDANLCSVTVSATVTQPSAVTVTVDAVTNADCNGNTTGGVNISSSGGGGGYSYNWSNGAPTEDLTNVGAGVYTVTATDIAGCTATASATVTEPTLFIVTIDSSNDVTCNGAGDGAIYAIASGGTLFYTYEWSDGQLSNDALGLVPGTYTLTATDGNGCEATASATIAEPSALVLTINGYDASCNGAADGCAAVTVTGGAGNYGFAWSNGSTGLDSICGLAAGTYTVTVTDTVSFGSSGTGPVLMLDTAYLQTFDGAPHGWTLNVPTGVNGADNNFWTVSAAEGGVLPNGCGAANNGNNTLHITSVFNPTGGAAYDAGGLCGILFCPETNMRAESPAFSTVGMASPTFRFDYIAFGSGLIDNASVWYNSGSGWTMLTASIKSLCCGGVVCNGFNQGQWTLYNVQLPASCANNPAVQVGINWTNNDDGVGTDPSVAINNVMVVDSSMSGGTPGTATIVCTATTTVTINEPAALSITVDGTTPVSCNGGNDGTASISVSGGTPAYTFTWSDGSTTTEDLGAAAAGVYTVTVADANGCTLGSANVTITEPTPVTITIDNVVDASCTGALDGSVSATSSGGNAPYTYNWSNGGTTEDLSGVAANNYFVTITDANGCVAMNGTTVGQAVLLDVSISASVDPSCAGGSDGSATAVGSGGTPAYSFDWGGGNTNASLTDVAAGTYMVTMTDVNGCSDTVSITIIDPAPVTLTLDTVNLMTSCGVNDGALAALAAGGTGAFTYAWSNGPATAANNGLSAGAYSVTATDGNGCSATASATIVAPFVPSVNPFVITPGITDTTVAWGDVTAIDGGNNQSSQGVTYQWTSVGTPPSNPNIANATAHSTTIMPDEDGTYTFLITATSADGCTATGTITVTVQAEGFIGMPDAFTPNGDNLNDKIRPIGLKSEFVVSFRIYNRFGEKVYDFANDPDLSDYGWNGDFRNQPQARDQYMYVLEYQLPSDSEVQLLRGEVMLIR